MEHSTHTAIQEFKHSGHFYNQDQLRFAIDLTMKAANLKCSSFYIQNTDKRGGDYSEFDKKNKLHNSLYPITYQRQKIAYLGLIHNDPLQFTEIKKIQLVINKIALLIKRFQASELSKHYLHQDLALTGLSEQSLKIESFIEKAACGSCPIIIEGEFGCEKLSVASAIHYNSRDKHKPFIEINCSTLSSQEFKAKLISIAENMSEGSLFLSEIDKISLEQQNILLELFVAHTPQSNKVLSANLNKNIRLLTSSDSSLYGLVNNNSFSKALYTYLNFLTILIPPIRERKEDVPYIINKLIDKHRVFSDQVFSTELKQALYDYDWPENYLEMERVVTKLLTLSSHSIINIIDLDELTPDISIKESVKEESRHQHLISNLFGKNYIEFSLLHKGLQNALKYLAENYCKNMTLRELAENAFVSESHLSYLFKFHLKRTFKQILVELRIEKAKSILKKNPHCRITEVSLDAGFGDLSHFEKMFKRYTQVTPREYKNQLKLVS